MLRCGAICKDYRCAGHGARERSFGPPCLLTLCHCATQASACRLPPWTTHVAHALVRFGLGRRGGEPLPADPGAWARAQLSGPDPLRLANPPTTAAGLAALREDRENRPTPGAVAGSGAVPPGCRGAAGQRADHAGAVPRAAGLVLDQPLHGLVAPRRVRGAGGGVRRGGDPPACHRALRRHAARGHAPSRDAAVSRQRRLGRDRTARPASAASAG